MTPRFRKLQSNDTYHVCRIIELLRTTYNPDVSKYFIYQSSAYSEFFESVISTEYDSIYIGENLTTDSLIGFVQFKHKEGVLFLNNIIIEDAYRGTGIGSNLLAESIKSVKIEHQEISTFALDVFEHNSNVYQWYLRTGMAVTATRFWYDAFPAYRNAGLTAAAETLPVAIKADKFGFNQVFVYNERVATLIDENTLMLANFSSETLNSLSEYFKDTIQRICYISTNEEALPIIDISHRLEIPLDDFLAQTGSRKS